MEFIRPPSLEAPSEVPKLHRLPKLENNGQPCVTINHPDYDNSVLLELAAFDPIPPSGESDGAEEHEKGEVPVGVHHGTVLIICAIVANNRFDVYLSRDRDGGDRVDRHLHRDGILKAGNYWAQLPPTGPAEAGQEEERTTTTGRRWPPYPIVSDFESWDFPHGRIPEPWQEDHNPPAPLERPQNSDSTAVADVLAKRRDTVRSCVISGHTHSTSLEKAHIVPAYCAKSGWFNRNGMDRYGKTGERPTHLGAINVATNYLDLRADIHRLFDSRALTILPKPVYVTPSPPTSGANPTADPASQETKYALAVHVLQCKLEEQEVVSLYHNQALRPPSDKLSRKNYSQSREFFFARLGWSVFPLLSSFLGQDERYLIVRKVPKGNKSTPSKEPKPKPSKVTGWFKASTSLTGSKRSASEISVDTTQAECDNLADDEPDGTLHLEGRASTTPGLQDDTGASQVHLWLKDVEAAGEGGPFTQNSAQSAVMGADEAHRGRRSGRGKYGKTRSGSNSPCGSELDPPGSPEGDLSSPMSSVCNEGGNADGTKDNGVSMRGALTTKDGPLLVGDAVLQEDVTSN